MCIQISFIHSVSLFKQNVVSVNLFKEKSLDHNVYAYAVNWYTFYYL